MERTETSTLHKMKETFWTTKQAVIQKLGKKEDEHVVASDSELDSKLEVGHVYIRDHAVLLWNQDGTRIPAGFKAKHCWDGTQLNIWSDATYHLWTVPHNSCLETQSTPDGARNYCEPCWQCCMLAISNPL